jgi:hypothetical protein
MSLDETPSDDQQLPTASRTDGTQSDWTSVLSAEVEHAIETANKFLSTLFPEPDLILFRPIETWEEDGQKDSKPSYRHTLYRSLLSVPLTMLRLLEVAEKERLNIFFGVCPRFGRDGQFDLAWQIRKVRALWTDIDHVTVAEALERVTKAGLPRPSIIVNSGNGVHLYWLLDQPYLIDDVGDPPAVETEWSVVDGKNTAFRYIVDANGQKISVKCKRLLPRLSPKAQHLQDILGGIASLVSGDHTNDLVRLLRIPGTLNRKDERNGKTPIPCTLVELAADRRYAVSIFEPFAEHSPDRKRRMSVAKMALPALRKELSPKKEDRLNDAIAQSQIAECGQRSEADFAVCCEAIRCGLSMEQLRARVQDVGKFQEGGEAYFNRTWEAAADEVREEVYEKQEKKKATKERKQARIERLQKSASRGSRPELVIDVDEARVATEAIAALAKHGGIYQRSSTLVHILADPPAPPCLNRPEGGLRILSLPHPRLRELLTLAAVFVRDTGRDGLQPCHPPDWLVKAVGARGEWLDIPRLEAVVETPVLLADGTILQTPGYDPRSGLYYSPAIDFPLVPEQPTRLEVEQAKVLLLEIVTDFPFQTPAHRAAWFAAILTPGARHAIDGPCPLFAIDANVRGSGKTMLCDSIGIVYTGRLLARTGAPKDDEEARKKITSIALSAEPHVLVDNVTGSFGSSAIDAALTATTWSDRILGKSQMTGAVPLATIWFVTGNNMVFVGDTPRRTLPIRLESNLEKPEEREGFRHPNLLAWVRKERGRLAVAALTILKGYISAGRPDQKLKSWGSFEEWSRLVRHAVVWCGLEDPGATRPEFVEASDSRAQQLRLLLAGWDQADPKRHGMTAEQAVNRATEAGCELLREVFAHLGTPDKPVSSRSLGMKLHHFKGRVCAGRRFVRFDDTSRGAIWKVEKAGEAAGRDAQTDQPVVSGTKGTKGTISQLRGENENSCVRTQAHIEGARSSPSTAFSPSEPPLAPNQPQPSCASLHVRPDLWIHRDDKAHCPTCRKFMGNVRSEA